MKTMKVTKKILPGINNIDFAGRVYGKPFVNESGTRLNFSVIRNFGGDKEAAILDFTMLRKPTDKPFPEYIKSGAPVKVHAYFNPDVYTNKEGEKQSRIQYIVKKVEKAEVSDKNVVESVNNIDFAGRVYGNPTVNAAGTCLMFTLIRNFGGGKEPVKLDFTMLRKKDGPAFPDYIKKGEPVTAHAYFNPTVYTDKEGNTIEKIQLMIKTNGTEQPELVEKTFNTKEEAAEADAQDETVTNTEIIEQ